MFSYDAQKAQALSIPLRIKYSCPPASKRDDSTLWEIAQDHYCEFTHVVLEVLQQQKSEYSFLLRISLIRDQVLYRMISK